MVKITDKVYETIRYAICKKADELITVVDNYIDQNATHSELLETVDELRDMVYSLDNYTDLSVLCEIHFKTDKSEDKAAQNV